jgi:tetratricopeptide (TPR) repeat protein
LLCALVAVTAAAAQEPAPADLERRGDLAAAAERYLALIASEPQRAEWALGAARCLRAVGRINDALRVLTDAEQRLPTALDLPVMRASTYHLKAEAEVRAGVSGADVGYLFEEAADVVTAVLDADPAHREARLILAQSRFQLGQLDAAWREAEQAAQRFPDHPGGALLLGRIAYHRFVTLLAQARAAEPRSKEWAELLEQAAAERERARAAFESAVAIDSERALPHLQLGNIHGWQNNVEQALVNYERALARDPACGVDHDWVARSATPERRLQMYRAADAAYRKRADATPERLAALSWWSARALYEAKDFAGALPLFVAAAADPARAEALHWAMLCAYAAGDHERAEEHGARFAERDARAFADLVRAQERPQDSITVLQVLADRAFDGKRLARSRDLNRVLAMVTDTADHWNNYAFLCRETGAFEASWQAYEHALSLQPDSPRLLNDAAVILQYHLPTPENLARARAMYQRAIKLANAIVTDRSATPEERKAARQAKDDARANLVKLED